MNNTYILISRKLIESDIFSKPPLYLKLWMWLLVQANFADNNGLKRGQVRTTYAEMREAMSYYVGFRKVKPSKSEVFRALEYMRGNERDSERNTETPMIETVKTTRHILVTICNYNDYQDPNFYERNDEDTANETSKSLRPVTRINKKDKNISNIKDITRGTDAPQHTVRQKIMDKWNELPVPNVKSINPNTNRYKMLNTRVKEYGVEGVLKAIENIPHSPHLLGNNKSGWVVTFDWFVRPNNFIKVYEGTYLPKKSKENTLTVTEEQLQSINWEE